MRNTTAHRNGDRLAILTIFVLTWTSGCGGGGGGGGSIAGPGTTAPKAVVAFPEVEGNDTFGDATPLFVGETGSGDLFAVGDVDHWSFEALAGDVLRIELRATSLDQAGWADPCSQAIVEVFDAAEQLLRRQVTGVPFDQDVALVHMPVDGVYFLRVRSNDPAGGSRYAITIESAGLGTVQVEEEPEATPGLNDNVANAELIVPGTLRGYHVNLEHDFFGFTVDEPTLMYAEIQAARLGAYGAEAGRYDPRLILRDAAGLEIDNNDDSYSLDSALQRYLAPGIYYLDVYQWNSAAAPYGGQYFLTLDLRSAAGAVDPIGNGSLGMAHDLGWDQIIATSTFASDYYRLTGEQGDAIRIWIYDNGENSSALNAVTLALLQEDGATEIAYTRDSSTGLDVATVILPTTGTFYLRVDASLLSESLYALRVERFLSAPFEHEGNEDPASAEAYGVVSCRSGAIDAEDDRDVFSFSAVENQLVTFTIHGGSADFATARYLDGYGSAIRPVLRILDAAGAVVSEVGPGTCNEARRTSTLAGNIEVTLLAPADGTYFLEVTQAPGVFGGRQLYVIDRTP